MENYNKLLNEIKEFLTMEEVTSDNDIISMYDLYINVNHELNGLKELLTMNTVLEKKIINYLKFFSIFSLKKDMFLPKAKLDVKLYSNNMTSSIIFKIRSGEVNVNKDKNSKEIYMHEELKKDDLNIVIFKFIKSNYCLILDILYKLEEYSNLVGNISTKETTKIMDFSNELFVVNLSCDNKGNTNVLINVNPDHLCASEYSKDWYTKKAIYSFVNENMEAILKRIPVSIKEIDNNFLNIYNQNQENEHVKSIKWWN